MKKVLITGGNGYVGTSLYNRLSTCYDVKKITRADLDLTNSREVNSFLDKGCYDVVIHCAVEGGSRLKKDTWSTVDANLKMYYNLVSSKYCYNKFLHFGSGAELYAIDTPYGLSKHIIRQSILERSNCYNLRIFGVFDENEVSTRFIKSNITRYINKTPLQVHADKYMDFMYMPDLVKLVEYYIDSDNLPKEINCNYKSKHTLVNIANLINAVDEHKVDIVIGENTATDYTGEVTIELPIDYIGLEQGIINTYKQLLK